MKYSPLLSRLASLSLLAVLLVLAGTSLWITMINEQRVVVEITERSSVKLAEIV